MWHTLDIYILPALTTAKNQVELHSLPNLQLSQFSSPVQHLFLPWFPSTTQTWETMDWDAEWNESANKAWVPETQLAGNTQISVQDFRGWWDRYTPSLPLYRSRSPYIN